MPHTRAYLALLITLHDSSLQTLAPCMPRRRVPSRQQLCEAVRQIGLPAIVSIQSPKAKLHPTPCFFDLIQADSLLLSFVGLTRGGTGVYCEQPFTDSRPFTYHSTCIVTSLSHSRTSIHTSTHVRHIHITHTHNVK